MEKRNSKKKMGIVNATTNLNGTTTTETAGLESKKEADRKRWKERRKCLKNTNIKWLL